MKASIVKYFFSAGYTMRQTAIISEVSEDYVRKIMSGKRALKNRELVVVNIGKSSCISATHLAFL